MAPPHYTTPGVYVAENLSNFSISAVPTSLPAFVGYTEKAWSTDNKSLELQPTPVASLLEFEVLFGKAPKYTFPIYERSDKDGTAPAYTPTFSLNNKTYGIDAAKSGYFLLYNSIRLYFQNGGGPAYIVSVGTYESAGQARKDELLAGLQSLEKLTNPPTLLIIPDALALEQAAHDVDRCVMAVEETGGGDESDRVRGNVESHDSQIS
ncbi:MAG: hypothetical protein KDC44_17765, partial [Phaeodactylibacter sp.]|nr:hypothetical protein [Phaeodactylibacter sp.]